MSDGNPIKLELEDPSLKIEAPVEVSIDLSSGDATPVQSSRAAKAVPPAAPKKPEPPTFPVAPKPELPPAPKVSAPAIDFGVPAVEAAPAEVSVPAPVVETAAEVSYSPEVVVEESTQTSELRRPSGPPPLGPVARIRARYQQISARLRRIEKDSILIAIGAFLAVSAAFLMIVGFSLEKPELTFPVGKVSAAKGTALRQLESESEYRPIGVDTGAIAGQDPGVVYNRDTVLTGSTSTLRIQFDSGAWVEMENDTMIRLLFDAGPEKGRIQVIAGRVRGSGIDVESRDGQKWIPLANQIEMVSPREGERLRIEDPAVPLTRVVRFEWKLPVPAGVMEVRLIYLGLDRSEPSHALTAEAFAGPQGAVVQPEIFRRVIGAKNAMASTFVPLSRPGIYEWELRDAWGNVVPAVQGVKGLIELKRKFTLSPELELIQVHEPLVAGKLIKTNLYQGEPLRAADLTLRWASFGGSGKYMVDLLDMVGSRVPFQRREAESETLTIGQEQVSKWNFHYRVLTAYTGGFVAVSKPVPFRFEIVAPVAVFPPPQAELSLAQLKKTDRGGLMLTWERTYFSDAYLIEVSQDPGFSRAEVAKTVKHNFITLKGLKPGRYHWRVKAVGLKRESTWSQPRAFNLGV